MSDENAPKLRLKPKLASDPSAAQQQPAAASPAPVEPAPPAAALASEEPKNVRLKPRISIVPVQETAAPAEPAAVPPPPEPEPVEPPPPPVQEKPVAKFSLKPKAAVTEPAPAPAAPPEEGSPPPDASGAEAPPSLEAPPPTAATAETDRGEGGEPGEITAMRRASVMPFHPPPPPAGVPFPPLAGAQFPPPTTAKRPATGAKKQLIKIGGGAVVVFVLGVLVGRFTVPRPHEEPPLPSKPKLAATPQGQAAATAKEVIEKAKEEAAAPVNEVIEADPATAPPPPDTAPATPAATKPAETAVATAPEPAPAVVVPVAPPPPPPPPPASAAFRAWVDGLRIGGVRGGANPRIFIGGTAYVPGDLVNPKLGITLEGYNPQTRMLTFKDKSGAIVDRRN